MVGDGTGLDIVVTRKPVDVMNIFVKLFTMSSDWYFRYSRGCSPGVFILARKTEVDE